MEPALHDGQCFTVRALFPWQALRRGDIITFRDEAGDSVKRIIGLPGETIRLRLGYVILDGVELNEAYVPGPMPTPAASAGSVLVADRDEYIVMGDNRTASYDSRDFGALKRDRIYGRLRVPAGSSQ